MVTAREFPIFITFRSIGITLKIITLLFYFVNTPGGPLLLPHSRGFVGPRYLSPFRGFCQSGFPSFIVPSEILPPVASSRATATSQCKQSPDSLIGHRVSHLLHIIISHSPSPLVGLKNCSNALPASSEWSGQL